jgi:hypothetical protein
MKSQAKDRIFCPKAMMSCLFSAIAMNSEDVSLPVSCSSSWQGLQADDLPDIAIVYRLEDEADDTLFSRPALFDFCSMASTLMSFFLKLGVVCLNQVGI